MKTLQAPASVAVEQARATRSPLFNAVLVLALIVGVALRTISLLKNRSLWMDESMFGLNIALFPARELLPLPLFEQLGAPLYVLLERASVVMFGMSEHALRLVPFLASCLLLPAVWMTGRRLIGPEAALAAVCTAAVMPRLVNHAAEAKPYSIDALIAVVLVGLAATVMQRPALRRRWIVLLLAGLVGIALSIPAVFVLASICVVLLASLRDARARTFTFALGAAWSTLFALVYFTVYHTEPTASYNQHFWQAAFLGSPHTLGRRPDLIFTGLLSPFMLPDWWLWRVMILSVIAAGAAYLFTRDRWIVGLTLGPVVINIVASFARAFPFGGRVSLFAAPLYCILVGAGAAAIANRFAGDRRLYASIGIVGVLMLPSARTATALAIDPEGMGDPRTVVRALLQQAQPDEPVYVFARSVPNWVVNSTDWSAPDTARARRLIRAASAQGPNSGNAPTRGRAVDSTEGDDLRFPFRSSVEILGIPSGIESLDNAPPSQMEPDSGWADREVARMREVAQPTIWLFVSHARRIAERSLLAAVCTSGRVLYQVSRLDASAYRIGFAPVDSAETDLCTEVLDRLNTTRRQE